MCSEEKQTKRSFLNSAFAEYLPLPVRCAWWLRGTSKFLTPQSRKRKKIAFFLLEEILPRYSPFEFNGENRIVLLSNLSPPTGTLIGHATPQKIIGSQGGQFTIFYARWSLTLLLETARTRLKTTLIELIQNIVMKENYKRPKIF